MNWMIVSLIITPYILYRSRVHLTQNLKFRPEISAPSRATLKSIFKDSRIQATARRFLRAIALLVVFIIPIQIENRES